MAALPHKTLSLKVLLLIKKKKKRTLPCHGYLFRIPEGNLKVDSVSYPSFYSQLLSLMLHHTADTQQMFEKNICCMSDSCAW